MSNSYKYIDLDYTYIEVLIDQDDYIKISYDWKYIKAKLKKEKNKLVSATTQLKFRTSNAILEGSSYGK